VSGEQNEHGTFRVRWDYTGDVGAYHSETMSRLSQAQEYLDMILSQGVADAWIERADWIPLSEWVGAQ
jgi:hypothetical protein